MEWPDIVHECEYDLKKKKKSHAKRMDENSAIKFDANSQNHEIENQNDIFLSSRTNKTKKTLTIEEIERRAWERDYMTKNYHWRMFNAHIQANQLHFPLKKQILGGMKRKKTQNTDADADTMSMMHSVGLSFIYMRIKRFWNIFYFPGSWPETGSRAYWSRWLFRNR